MAVAAGADGEALARGGPDPVGGPRPTRPADREDRAGVFLAVVGALFALFVSAYVMRMDMADWRPLPLPLVSG